MEELVLRAVLVRQELDVVDDQHVGRGPVAGAELLHRAAAGRALLVHHRADEVGHELLAGDEADGPLGVLEVDLVPDRLQEVRLPQADAAVDEERVPARGRRLGHHARRRVGELVGRPDHELVEGVALEQLGWPSGREMGGTRVSVTRRADTVDPRRPALFARLLLHRLFHHLEVDLEGALGARFHVLEDRREEIVLEPLLVVAVRRPQADAPVVDADTLDGPQPEIAVRRFDQRLDRSDGLGPQIKHHGHRLSTAQATAIPS